MKVSFDFGSTLTLGKVQAYAKELVERGIEVWIVTSRKGFGKEPNPTCNDDLFEVAERIGIKKENIHFCCMANKSEFLKDKNFVFHIDDDNIELSFVKTDTDVKPIYLFGNRDWRSDCEKAILKSCKHPKKRRTYIGEGFLRCGVCGLEFK